DTPILSHPTDAIGSPDFAIELGKLGGLGVLNAEGLFSRHRDAEAQLEQVVDLAASDITGIAAIRRLQELHAAPLDP
ncbi:GuaB3 family IMP dehydrogenase-related protein, partial [Mycobacterium kansasii]